MLSSTLQVFSPYCFLLEYCGTVRNLCIQQVLPGGTGSVELRQCDSFESLEK
jgi:hypothetical protein